MITNLLKHLGWLFIPVAAIVLLHLQIATNLANHAVAASLRITGQHCFYANGDGKGKDGHYYGSCVVPTISLVSLNKHSVHDHNAPEEVLEDEDYLLEENYEL